LPYCGEPPARRNSGLLHALIFVGEHDEVEHDQTAVFDCHRRSVNRNDAGGRQESIRARANEKAVRERPWLSRSVRLRSRPPQAPLWLLPAPVNSVVAQPFSPKVVGFYTAAIENLTGGTGGVASPADSH
jgi:hypothetical protein